MPYFKRARVLFPALINSGFRRFHLVHIIADLIRCLHDAAARKVQVDAAAEPRLVATRVQLLPLPLQRGALLRCQPLVRVHAVVVRLVVDDLSSLLAGDVIIKQSILVVKSLLEGFLQGAVVPENFKYKVHEIFAKRLEQCWGFVTFWCGSGSADPYL